MDKVFFDIGECCEQLQSLVDGSPSISVTMVVIEDLLEEMNGEDFELTYDASYYLNKRVMDMSQGEFLRRISDVEINGGEPGYKLNAFEVGVAHAFKPFDEETLRSLLKAAGDDD